MHVSQPAVDEADTVSMSTTSLPPYCHEGWLIVPPSLVFRPRDDSRIITMDQMFTPLAIERLHFPSTSMGVVIVLVLRPDHFGRLCVLTQYGRCQ